jgi:hypothetical protein
MRNVSVPISKATNAKVQAILHTGDTYGKASRAADFLLVAKLELHPPMVRGVELRKSQVSRKDRG